MSSFKTIHVTMKNTTINDTFVIYKRYLHKWVMSHHLVRPSDSTYSQKFLWRFEILGNTYDLNMVYKILMKIYKNVIFGQQGSSCSLCSL